METSEFNIGDNAAIRDIENLPARNHITPGRAIDVERIIPKSQYLPGSVSVEERLIATDDSPICVGYTANLVPIAVSTSIMVMVASASERDE